MTELSTVIRLNVDKLSFLRRQRAEQRFDSKDALQEQIAQDVAEAQRYFDALQ